MKGTDTTDHPELPGVTPANGREFLQVGHFFLKISVLVSKVNPVHRYRYKADRAKQVLKHLTPALTRTIRRIL